MINLGPFEDGGFQPPDMRAQIFEIFIVAQQPIKPVFLGPQLSIAQLPPALRLARQPHLESPHQ
jgi:hypothetical protein